jgi:chromosomal replication initiator protein
MVHVASIWHTTLERLDMLPVDAVCKGWLDAASLIQAPNVGTADSTASDDAEEMLYFLLQVPDRMAQEILNTHWRPTIEDLLADVAGQPVSLSLVYEAGESTPMHETPDLPDARSQLPAARSSTSEYTYYEIPAPARPETQSGTHETYFSRPAPGSHYQPLVTDALTEEWDNEQRANILMHNRLNPRYSFDTFIVGNSNRLAHAASLAVAEAPGESYNPLFLYGGVGLGKTHLLHAIGHQGVQTGLAVLYVSSEQFTNEIVNAIRYRTTEEFRAKYRSVDILLVDDIQFIAGKESTEEEFFHTFNSLYELSKQIVICSDRPPKAIVSLEERLRSRFEWGLIADIQPPDLETRMAILRVKADALRYRVPDEIIAYIAGRVQTNIRELEGCLNRLMAYQQLHRTELTIEVARAAMSSLGEDVRESRLNSRQIAEVVAEFYHISLEAMCGKQRDKHIVMPRQIAMYLIRQETTVSLLEIGQLFGGRDHSTVLHACEKIDRAVNINPILRREIVAIREQLLRES